MSAHVDAVKALLAGAVRLYDGAVPDNPTLPYAVLYAGIGTDEAVTLSGLSSRRDTTVQVTSVALDAATTRGVAERVRAALVDSRPTLPGRAAWPIRHTESQPLRIDRDVTPHRLYLVDLYAFASVPATPPQE